MFIAFSFAVVYRPMLRLGSGGVPQTRPWRWPSGFWSGSVVQLAMQIPALAEAGHAVSSRRELQTIPACESRAS